MVYESIPGGESIIFEKRKGWFFGKYKSKSSNSSKKSNESLESIPSNTVSNNNEVKNANTTKSAGSLSNVNPEKASTKETQSNNGSSYLGSIGNVFSKTFGFQSSAGSDNRLNSITARLNLIAKPRPPITISPLSITTVLSSVLFVMQCYCVHPSYQIQVLRQLM